MRIVAPAVFQAVLLLATSCPALTIDEAVSKALAENHRIKQARHLEEAAAARIGAAESGFYPSFDASYHYRNSEQENIFQDRESSLFTLELSYNLFKGNADARGLDEARSRAAAAGHRRRSVTADLALAVKWAYIDLVKADLSVETSQEGVTLLQDQARRAELFFQQGLIARNDLLRVQVELSSARQELLKAQGDQSLALKGLGRLMGDDPENDERRQISVEPPKLENLTFSALQEEMFRNRSELQSLKSEQEALEQRREGLRAGYRPRVDFVLSHENFGDSLVPDGREEGYDSNTTAMLNATWNLFDGRRKKHDIMEADSRAKANAEAIRDLEAELVLQLETALERFRVARGNIDTAQVAVEQAEENYRVNESLFRQRQGTTTDVVDARFLLTRSRNEFTDALAEIHKSFAGLERVLERSPVPTVEK